MRRSGAEHSWKNSAPVFAALGDETRLHIVTRLCEEGPRSITRLAEGSRVSRQAVTKHLRVLADAGLVKSTRDGRESVWELKPGGLQEARRLLDVISREWDDTLERLRAFVESDEGQPNAQATSAAPARGEQSSRRSQA
jgi:DNA-binding transcriptional ArsR family regulator